MSERDDRGRQPAEGVRIIKAEEAQAALDAGEAAGRRPDDQLRFGDVPPAPSGPRPAHRFPLPDSVDPAEVAALPPLAPRRGERPPTEARPAAGEPGHAVEGPAAGGPRPPDPARPAAGAPPPIRPGPQPTADAPRPTIDAARAGGATPEPPQWTRAAADPDRTSEWEAVPAVEPPAGSDDWDADDWQPHEAEAWKSMHTAPPVPRPRRSWADRALSGRRGRGNAPRSGRAGDSEDLRWRPEPAEAPTTVAASHDDETAELGIPPLPADEGPGVPPRTPPEEPWARPALTADRPAPRPEWAPAAQDDPALRLPGEGQAVPTPNEPARPVPEEGITVTGSSPEMPHWSDPPTGEVPRLRFDSDADEVDDLEAWRSLGSRGVRWRDEDDWDEADELSDLMGDSEPMGALDQNRTEHSDLYSFDEDFERVTSRTGSHPVVDLTDAADSDQGFDYVTADPDPGERRTARGATTARRGSGRAATVGRSRGGHGPGSTGGARTRTGAPSGTNEGGRVAVGVGLIVLLIIAYAIGAKALVVLAAVVILAAAAEAYQMMRTAGFRPATLLGLVATVGTVFGGYWRGIEALPIIAVLFFGGAILWYVLGIVEARPLANVAVSVMVYVWVGVLGSFSGVLLSMHKGKGLFLGAVLIVAAADIGAFAVGRMIGSRPMAAHISPNKTVEGFIGGVTAAVIVGLVVGKELAPWGGMKHGLLLGLLIGLVAPAGDLFESMVKRDLGIKDSGRVLGGHGGLLDRFDALLLALPAAYFIATFFRV